MLDGNSVLPGMQVIGVKPSRFTRGQAARLHVVIMALLKKSQIASPVLPKETVDVAELGGEVVGVDFDRDDGRWIYEFKVIGPAGRLVEVHVDAATARVLRRQAD